MTETLWLILAIGIFFYFVLVIHLLKTKLITLKYTLLWLAMGGMLLILIIFPQLLDWIGVAMGFALPINALLVGMIAFAFVLLMALTSIVSKQSEKIKRLVQESALLEKRIRELERQGGMTEDKSTC